MLGVLPFGEDPNLSGTAGPAVPSTSATLPITNNHYPIPYHPFTYSTTNSAISILDNQLYIVGQECFGLLGVNGAGKTTTFRMLTGDEMMSR